MLALVVVWPVPRPAVGRRITTCCNYWPRSTTPIFLADEPTGNLDSATGDKVINIMFDNAQDAGAALVLVTHDVKLASRCDRIIRIEDGHITDDSQK